MSAVFRHAVASFDPTGEAVLLWTRLTGATSATWVLARDAELTDVVATGEQATGPARDSTVVVDATGLEPATTYFYRFSAGGEDSPVGRTRTLPVDELVLGLVSCARYSVAPLTVYRAMAQREVDLVLHLGDYVYEDDGAKGPREHRPRRTAVSLQDYRDRIAQTREDPDCQALHLRHPMAVVVDDHDVADNAWRGGAKKHEEGEHGPWGARALAAMTARSEWLPSRRRDEDVMVTWRSLVVGDLAEVLLLDSRVCGRDLQASEPGARPLTDPERTILGTDQRVWLQERLADVSRPWALVANGVVVNELVLRPPAPTLPLVRSVLPEGYDVHEDQLLRDDGWDGYPADRRRLVEALAGRRAAGGGSVLLSGDVHSSWAFEGPCTSEGDPVTVEVVTPSVSSAPMGRTRLPVVWRALDQAVRRLEHVKFVDVTNRGFVVLHVSASRVVSTWHFADPYDTSDEPEAPVARCLSVPRSTGPARWSECSPLAEPVRPGLPAPLPGRPDDVPAARHRHQRRRAAGLGAVSLVAGAALAGTVRGLRR